MKRQARRFSGKGSARISRGWGQNATPCSPWLTDVLDLCFRVFRGYLHGRNHGIHKKIGI